MKKKKILVLTSSFPRSENDWWARYILELYLHLNATVYDVTVYAPHSPGARLREKIKWVKVIRFPYFFPLHLQKLTLGQGIMHNDKSLLSKVQIITFVACELFMFLLHLGRNKYDFVHAHWILPQGLIAYFAKLIFGTQYMISVHGSDIFALRKFSFLKKIALDNAAIVTVNSQATYKAVQKISSSVPLVLIPMGIDLQLFHPHKTSNSKERKRNIVAVGRLIIWKGYDYLIRALPLIVTHKKNIHVFIVGSGPEKENLVRSAKKNHVLDCVTFLGNLPQMEVASLFSRSDLFVSPAITNTLTGEREGQGLAVLEAMASGLPVIASRSGGIQYLIDDGKNGLLVAEKDPEVLAKTIVELLDNEKRSELLKTNGLQYVKKHFSWDIIAEKFDKVFVTITR